MRKTGWIRKPPETSEIPQNTQDYQHIYEQEQEISRPKRIDYLKIAVLTILILALLTLPFSAVRPV